MTTARREYFLLIVGLILLIVTGAGLYYMQRAPNRSRDMAQVSQLVTSFGNYEKSISPLAPTSTVENDIQQNYGQFVTNDLLQQWRADPSHAPGRLTSSPWPDHIVIDAISPQGAGYIVSGHIVMMTSTGESGQIPVVLFVLRENDTWKIAAYQEAAQASSAE
jgi:hypothetical protein